MRYDLNAFTHRWDAGAISHDSDGINHMLSVSYVADLRLTALWLLPWPVCMYKPYPHAQMVIEMLQNLFVYASAGSTICFFRSFMLWAFAMSSIWILLLPQLSLWQFEFLSVWIGTPQNHGSEHHIQCTGESWNIRIRLLTSMARDFFI